MTFLCKLTCQSHMQTLSWIQNIQLCLPMSSSQTEVLLPLTTQNLFHTHTNTTIFPLISNFQDETPCPPSDEKMFPKNLMKV